jgi:quinohemoprotein ethanol dehydrogenase
MRHFVSQVVATLGSVLACVVATAATGAPSSRWGDVDEARLAGAAREPAQWLATGRDLSGGYYSPLTQISRDNVAGLGFAWEYRLGTRRGLVATPLVVDGVMYTSGNWGIVYALDATTGKLRWTYDPASNRQQARYEQNDVVNRGVAIWKGRVYVVAADCRLIALEASSGAKVWETNTLADPTRPYACSGYPQLAGGVVVVGNAGGDTSPGGLRGYVTAYDLGSGALRWRFYTVPSLAEKNPPPELIAAARTWDPKRDPAAGGGGTVWNGMAYDPALGLVFLGTGNAAPYGAPRDPKGHGTDNLYTASILALNAETGKLVWYYQATPGDRWDFDATATLVQAELQINGQSRSVLMQANKNGYFYVLDRKTGKPISVKPFSYLNWSSGIDKDFRPIITSTADYHSSPKLIYPSINGAHLWQPMAFSPKTGLVYIPVIDAPSFLVDLNRNPGAGIKFVDEATDGVAYVVPDASYDAESLRPTYGALPKVPAANPKTGKPLVRAAIRAWDPVAQRVMWEQETSKDFVLFDGGTLATAGDLVFAGREDGSFVAYDAETGTIRKTLSTGTPIMAAPMSYEVNGSQYVAVLGGHGAGYLGSFTGTAAMKYLNDGRIMVFKLGGAAEVPKPPVRVTEPYQQPPPSTASASQIQSGSNLFTTWCARCHSLGTPGVTPDLARLRDGIENPAVFQAIVLKGAFLSRGMARFDDVLAPSDTEAIYAYLVDQAWANFKQQAAAAQSH